MVTNLIAFGGHQTIQNLAGIFILFGIPLMIGLALLNIHIANKKDKVGWIIVRFSYITLFITCFCTVMLTFSTFISSFTSGSTNDVRNFAASLLSVMLTSGVSLSILSYYILPIESALSFLES
jgi:hypothetical protein